MDRARLERLIRELLVEVGEDPTREGLVGTPARLAEVLAPFAVEQLGRPADWIRTSACAGEDGMVVVRDMGFISLCEHHLLPFFGRIHVGCMPRRRTCDADCCAGVVAKVAR